MAGRNEYAISKACVTLRTFGWLALSRTRTAIRNVASARVDGPALHLLAA